MINKKIFLIFIIIISFSLLVFADEPVSNEVDNFVNNENEIDNTTSENSVDNNISNEINENNNNNETNNENIAEYYNSISSDISFIKYSLYCFCFIFIVWFIIDFIRHSFYD